MSSFTTDPPNTSPCPRNVTWHCPCSCACVPVCLCACVPVLRNTAAYHGLGPLFRFSFQPFSEQRPPWLSRLCGGAKWSNQFASCRSPCGVAGEIGQGLRPYFGAKLFRKPA